VRLLGPDEAEALRILLGVYEAEWDRIREVDAPAFDEHAAALNRLADYFSEDCGGSVFASIVLIDEDEADALRRLLLGAPWEESALTESERKGLSQLRKELGEDDKQ
jgi:hypothetical protein